MPLPTAAVRLAAVASLLVMVTAGPASGLAQDAGGDQDAGAAPFNIGGHELDRGLGLAADDSESVSPGAACAPARPVRAYDVVAINLEITLNRFLDYDPLGRMYALEEELPRVRAEAAQNRDARAGRAEPAVSYGLQGDAIQPLTLRVNQGECLRISLRNDLASNEPASLHVHGSGLMLPDSGSPAIATNPEAIAFPGQTVVYEWAVPGDQPEGTHMFHSHGDARNQTNHGLFGALIVEPRGSRYLDPRSGAEERTGWDAIIQNPGGASFREFAFYYHEIGNERFQPRDKNGQPVITVDPFAESYRPGARALNYRSEPFMNRLALQQETIGRFDKSAAYSSYVFGDPATPMARSYLGDPVKQRVIHGGSEVFHVHHVHGGAIRWPRQPGEEPTAFDSGLDKHPALLPQVSERIDSQSIGPSETYDIVDECGSGGCQQSAGDYLIHCHVAQHYLSGMWTFWRVYNTRQGPGRQDLLPSLAELPERAGRMVQAVTSEELVGKTVDWKGQSFQISAANLNEWVERQLPPKGLPRGYDASVFNWQRQGNLYLSEPETDQVWPGYESPSPGGRPPIAFDPLTGKLAYPFLHPHLAQRPPFAPNHGPAPFLEPIHQATDPAQPGENGPWSLCPIGTRPKQFAVNAITLPLHLNQKLNLVDPSGQLYVLRDEEDAVRKDPQREVPLVIRANAGQDCVDVTLRSELEDIRENGFLSKADLHIHLVQFDVQASDGVVTGFNYEQSVRPYTIEGERLIADAAAGTASVRLGSANRFQAGAVVGVGMDQDQTFEVRQIQQISGDTLTFDRPLSFAHRIGETISTEFVRYRWYPDVQFGTAYFHDHVDALHSWQHGLFGAFISEPPGSTYHDPFTGAEIKSGFFCDIRTDAPVSADVTGSFREAVTFIQDQNRLTHIGDSTGSSYNLRVEPLAARRGDPSQLFSSAAHGDPATPTIQANLGDPLVLRTLVAGTNDVHTFHVDGHWFRAEPFSARSPPINTVHLGISERYDLYIPSAGGPQRLPGDYLYYSGRAFKLREGSWGILRVYDSRGSPLQPLPGHGAPFPSPQPSPAGGGGVASSGPSPPDSVCPDAAPQKELAVSAVNAPLPMLGRVTGKIYVLASDEEATLAGTRTAEPLVLHVNVGDCVVLDVSNETGGPVSAHVDLLAFDPGAMQAAAPGQTRTYTYYASPEVGETVAMLRDWGNVVENPRLGLYGAIVVGPPGATYTDPMSGEDVSQGASWTVNVQPAEGPSYRDFTLFMEDEDALIGTAIMPYVEQVQGVVGLNYRSEPLRAPLARTREESRVFASAVHGDPSTPVLQAYAGDPVKLRVLVPFSEQAHVFSVEGHSWPFEPGTPGTTMLSSVQVGGLEAVTFALADGAGGRVGLPGDYLYGDHREPYREAGLWGIFRVLPLAAETNLLPLEGR